MAAPFIRSSSRWVCRVGVAVTFFPPRSDTTHPLQRRCRLGVRGGAVSFRLSCTRWRRVITVCRAKPSSRARRWEGSPLAMPRSSSTSVEGDCCVLAKRGARQQGIVAVTVATAIGGEVFLLAKEPTVGAAAVGAMQPIGMEMLFEPVGASSIVEQVRDGKINHAFLPWCSHDQSTGPYSNTVARCLDMSPTLLVYNLQYFERIHAYVAPHRRLNRRSRSTRRYRKDV